MTSPHLDELADVVAELRGLYGEYAVCLEIELRAKVAAIRVANSSDMGVGATDQYTTISTVDATAECIKLRFDIKATEALRDYLMFAIEHNP